jgi:hypothetical protein
MNENYTHTRVLKLPLLIDQQKVGELVFFHNLLPLNHYFRRYFKFVYRKNVAMVTLTTGIVFLLLTCMCDKLYEADPAIPETLRRTDAARDTTQSP